MLVCYEVTGGSVEEITQEVNRILEHEHRVMLNVVAASTGQHVLLQFEVPGRNREQKMLLGELKGVEGAWKRDFIGPGGSGVSPKTPEVSFVKASACGNDFLLIEFSQAERALASSDIATFTQRICDRHEGVGADGVEWIYPHAKADVEIRLINADGSEAEISGNGTRCVAAYLCSQRGAQKITIQTGAGLKSCVLIAKNDPEYEFEIEMGEAWWELNWLFQIDGGEVRGIPVSMGNPHYVVFVQKFS